MINRRSLLTVAAGAALLTGVAGYQFLGADEAVAFDKVAFTTAAFEQAQKDKRSILVDISAPWCPTCRRQSDIIGGLSDQQKYADLIIFRVDYDSQKDVVRSFDAFRQSTLIGFNGETETARLVADTRKANIEALLDSTL